MYRVVIEDSGIARYDFEHKDDAIRFLTLAVDAGKVDDMSVRIHIKRIDEQGAQHDY